MHRAKDEGTRRSVEDFKHALNRELVQDKVERI
jgi:hypothetical protein